MAMTRYYWESKTSYGCFNDTDDDRAVKSALRDIPNVLVVYKESDTESGVPFIVLYKEEKADEKLEKAYRDLVGKHKGG